MASCAVRASAAQMQTPLSWRRGRTGSLIRAGLLPLPPTKSPRSEHRIGEPVELTDMIASATMGAGGPPGAAALDEPAAGPFRRCIVTREVLPKDSLVR